MLEIPGEAISTVSLTGASMPMTLPSTFSMTAPGPGDLDIVAGKALGVSQSTITRDLEGLCTTHKPPRPKGGRPIGDPAPEGAALDTEV